MSSSQQPATKPNSSEVEMMEAPDSPPETSHVPTTANQSLSSQSSNSQQQQQAAANRVNGDGNTKVNHGAPGSTWQTKKFNEEYERAANLMIHQDWDHTKYGDPLLQ